MVLPNSTNSNEPKAKEFFNGFGRKNSFGNYIERLYPTLKIKNYEVRCQSGDDIQMECLSSIHNVLCLAWVYDKIFADASAEDALDVLGAGSVLMETIARQMFELQKAIDQ